MQKSDLFMSRERIAIIGAGLMGHGLAAVFADAGHSVTITDPDKATLDAVLERVTNTLRSIDKSPHAVARVFPIADLSATVEEADIIIEAAPEKLALKQDIFKRLESAAKPNAILASNTSVIPIGQIGAHVKSKHRVIGTHWWNPPYLVPLVEVIQTEDTSSATVETMMTLLKKIGKQPVHVKKDVPGFVGNRLQHAMWREAVALVADGVCDAETIDLVVTSSFGRRLAVLGPMANADMVGTDLALDIQNSILPHLNRSTEPTDYLKSLVAQGKLGFKSNIGFQNWTEDAKQNLRKKVTEHLKLLNKILSEEK
jgi:3-hydroxybutyryl-CoA dehydrogenase